MFRRNLLLFTFIFKWVIPGLFFLYFRLFNTVDCKQMFDKSLPMTGFEPRISGVGGNRSTNWATTTALLFILFVKSCDFADFALPESFSNSSSSIDSTFDTFQHFWFEENLTVLASKTWKILLENSFRMIRYLRT